MPPRPYKRARIEIAGDALSDGERDSVAGAAGGADGRSRSSSASPSSGGSEADMLRELDGGDCPPPRRAADSEEEEEALLLAGRDLTGSDLRAFLQKNFTDFIDEKAKEVEVACEPK